MSRSIDDIKDINDSKETWRLAVRILDVWSVVNQKGSEHLEMVIMDSKGDRIQVLVRSEQTPKWKERIKEDMTCIINNGTVYDNDFQWKLCDHSKKFVFLGGTSVKVQEVNNIPPKRYFFKDFAEILKGNCRLERLEDIIGVVHEIVSVQSNSGGKKMVVDVNLKDLKGNMIKCSLWENYGSKFLNYYNQNKDSGAIVILLTHTMINNTQVSNGWNGSKLLINENIPEIQQFKSKLPKAEQMERPTQSSQSVSRWSGGSQYSYEEKFVFNATLMTLEDIIKLKVETVCITVATTLKFAVSKYGWFYYGCTSCTTKASDPKKAYECQCGEKVKEPIPRYKVETYVKCGDTKYRFVLWDTDCAAIIEKSADDVFKEIIEIGEDDPMVYPPALDKLLDKKMVFRVKIQPSFKQGFVSKLSREEAFIKQIENKLNIDENHTQPESAKAITSEDNLEFPIQSLSACGESDPEIMSALTPAKRVSNGEQVGDVDFEAFEGTQLSVTKPTKHVKIERKD